MTKEVTVTNSKTKELIELDKMHYIHPTSAPKDVAENGPGIIFSDGNGIYVNNLEGEPYIDGMSMLWNVNLGHGQEELAEVAKEQMLKIAYSSSFKGFSNEPAIKLAEKLATMAPGDLNAVFFTSGGSESNDTAFKLSRFYWEQKGKSEKRKIISTKNGYHGVTFAAQSATGIPATHEFAGSSVEGFYHATPHLINCELGDKGDPNYEQSIRSLIEKEGADTIAAVIIEPVQGAGGVNIPPEGYLQAVRKLCDEFDILFIADEVICGFGRTGKMFGVDNWDVVPDLMCIAKGITSGYAQLGGVMINTNVREEIVNFEGVLAHGFTYSGHPTACAVALKNIEIMERDGILENVQNMEKELEKGLAYLQDKHDIVRNCRTIGLLSAFELYNPERGEHFDPSVNAASAVVDECFDRKLILRHIGSFRVAIAPPLIINKQEIERMIQVIDESITAFKKKLG
ncbi:aminotransferase family protein [Virgibacillus necropolis]|uniref:Aspartate aminotransferase family protein n=1 Tax=Virgibacillus necropolis TaxID=163877 RepID=A0A221MF29_9BACI|nr:aspartate aminotransferase family protein [Virgibacillus necropolis]ASN06222.1 aspartate aminotransferase family protein [Virgibacillus necropolis]